jgi:cytidyltransferase-like protein
MSLAKPVLVYCDVVCDMFHAGHVAFLRQARMLGDGLIVGLVSDANVATYKPAPILSLQERVAVVTACRYVDRVVADPPLFCTETFLDSIGAAFACHGDDMPPEEIAHWYADLIPSGRIKVVPYTSGISSRQIVDRVAARLRDGSLRIRL